MAIIAEKAPSEANPDVHVLRIDSFASGAHGLRWLPACSCRAWFEYAGSYGVARMALDAHLNAIHALGVA